MNYKAQDFIDAIQGVGAHVDPLTSAPRTSGGIVTTIARRVGCTRQTVYNAIESYATVKQALHDERDSMKDMVEGKILEEIKAGNTTMIIFYAKTQMKDRGYVERQEHTGAGGGAIVISVSGVTSDDGS